MDESTARQLLEQERRRLRAIRDEQPGAAPNVGGDVGGDVGGQRRAERVETGPQRADVASEVFDREVEQSVAGHADAELAEIDSALRRLDEGRYGLCEECGRKISEDRLRTMPATRYCVEHQDLIENLSGVPEDRASGDPTATSAARPDRP